MIDADALKEKSVKMQDHLWNKNNDADANIIMEDDVRFRLYEEMEDCINDMPTIIEAEEEPLTIPWIFADLDTIIDSYSEMEEADV